MDFDYRLLAKYLTDTLSPEEMGEVERWRALSAENEEIFSRLVQLRASSKYTEYNTPSHIERALSRMNAKINRANRFLQLRSVMRYAAVILVLVSFSYAGWDYLKPENYVTITVKQGEEVKKLGLSDGSIVWLKEGSSLRIPETFSTDSRKLSLQGEAFFDVAKNDQFPFYVSTDYMNIKVLGTAFNVKINRDNQNVETILARGEVALLDKQWNAVFNMSPGEKVTYDNRKNEYATEIVDANICTSWHLNQFVFENITLREIVKQLSAKFNVNVNIESSKLAQRKFRCVINEDESLQDVLEQLCFLIPITYRIESSEIYISEKQTKK